MRAPGTGAAARILLALAGALTIGLVASGVPAAASSSAPAPSGSATLRGVLLLGDPGLPVGSSRVTLNGVASGADPLTLSAVTDARGRFTFSGLAGGDTWTYTVTAQHQGAQFSSDVLVVKAGATLTTTLNTYETTTDPAGITWPQWLVWLDVEGSTLAVEQDISMKNSGTRAYTGSVPVSGAPDGGKAAVVLPVAPGATSLSYLGSFEVCCDASAGTTWAHTRPVPPGSTTGTLRYEAPLVGSLSFPVRTATEAFTLLVPTGTQVSSPQLVPSGTQTDRGTTYQVLKGGPFALGTTVAVTLAGGSSSGGSSSAVVVVVAIVLALAAAAALAVWFLRRRRAVRATAPVHPPRKPAPAANTATSTTRAKPAKPTRTVAAKPAPRPAPAVAAGAGPRADDPDVLADELAMLDLAHESGSLPDEASYQRVRAALVERLMDAVGNDPDALSR